MRGLDKGVQLFDGHAKFTGDLLGGRFFSIGLSEICSRFFDSAEGLADVRRKSNGLGFAVNGAANGLFDPVGGIGGKSEALVGVEPADCGDESDDSFLDQVFERDASGIVRLCDVDYESDVRFDEAFFCIRRTILRGDREFFFFFSTEERGLSEPVQVAGE